jgi:hypothetical protein
MLPAIACREKDNKTGGPGTIHLLHAEGLAWPAKVAGSDAVPVEAEALPVESSFDLLSVDLLKKSNVKAVVYVVDLADLTSRLKPEPKADLYARLLTLKAGSQAGDALDELKAKLKARSAQCGELKQACVFAFVPLPVQADPSLHDAIAAQGYDVSDWMSGSTPLMARLTSFLKQEGLPYFDALPALRGRAKEGAWDRSTFRLSQVGQRIVADAMWLRLGELGFRPVKAGQPTPPSDRTPAGADLTPHETRLTEKANGLRIVQSEMQVILKMLPAQKEAAEALQSQLKALEDKVPEAEVKRVLKEAKNELDKRGPEPGSLRARAREIDEKLAGLMDKEPVAPDDPEAIARLKKEVRKLQESVAALGAGTAVALRALNVIEQMKIAIPKLEAVRDREADK